MAAANGLLDSFTVDRLKVQVYLDRGSLGKAAAEFAGGEICSRQKRADRVSIFLAAAPSQDEFLAYLREISAIDWERVYAFQLDAYIGLPGSAPQSFAGYLQRSLLKHVSGCNFFPMNGMAHSPEDEIRRYRRVLETFPPDLACLGVGMNGHLAFNDPPTARFNDPEPLRVVTLQPVSREQQVIDGCFTCLEDVPCQALTLTIPTLLSAKVISCVVPGKSKTDAVRRMLTGPVGEDCPATILRSHPHAVLFLDQDSAARL